MDEFSLIKKLSSMKSGTELEQELMILPEYNPDIINENPAIRLMALSDLFQIYVPNQMSKEIYSKLYLALLRSLRKKGTKLAVKQHNENFKSIKQQEYTGIIGGSDSFTIIGSSGIGKSSAISRAIQLIAQNQIIEFSEPYTKIIPCVIVQCPFDSSVKGLLFEILRVIDEQLGSKYYITAQRARATTDMLIGSVSQAALNHIGLLIVDEIQHVVNHKNGKSLVGCLTQLINNTGISICMVGTPESTVFFTQAMQLARRSLGLQYNALEYGAEFHRFCEVLFRYQYLKNRTVLDDAIIHWLYEHSNGNLSIVVSLVHDAQELAILEGTEALTIDTLNIAYKKRMTMLHSYVSPRKHCQTSKVRRSQTNVSETVEAEDDISISALILRSKNECIDIAAFLKNYITVDEVRI